MICTLEDIYATPSELNLAVTSAVTDMSLQSMFMGIQSTSYAEVMTFICTTIYGYFFEDYLAYRGDTAQDVAEQFTKRLTYDICNKFPYWYRKYNYIKKLLTDSDFSLLQTSKVTSSSSDDTQSAGGSLQKGATTPTGVSTGTSLDRIGITMSSGLNDIDTTGFVDKYTNYQQKYANANRVKGSRSGNISREGSIDELLNVLEKLPSSFASEITTMLQKHFIFDYDGVRKGYYD